MVVIIDVDLPLGDRQRRGSALQICGTGFDAHQIATRVMRGRQMDIDLTGVVMIVVIMTMVVIGVRGRHCTVRVVVMVGILPLALSDAGANLPVRGQHRVAPVHVDLLTGMGVVGMHMHVTEHRRRESAAEAQSGHLEALPLNPRGLTVIPDDAEDHVVLAGHSNRAAKLLMVVAMIVCRSHRAVRVVVMIVMVMPEVIEMRHHVGRHNAADLDPGHDRGVMLVVSGVIVLMMIAIVMIVVAMMIIVVMIIVMIVIMVVIVVVGICGMRVVMVVVAIIMRGFEQPPCDRVHTSVRRLRQQVHLGHVMSRHAVVVVVLHVERLKGVFINMPLGIDPRLDQRGYPWARLRLVGIGEVRWSVSAATGEENRRQR